VLQTEELETKWNAEEHGMQDAARYPKFATLPPVLQFHLLRFLFTCNAGAYKVRWHHPCKTRWWRRALFLDI
jgi:hypothetical protein